jgi:S1-C subfamily serine protease
MQRMSRILTSLLLMSLALYAQQEPNAQSSPVARGWISGWRDSTVSFGTIMRGRYYKVEGSGVVFSAVPTTAYIVTAKHVFFDPLKDHHPSEIQIRYGWQEQQSVYTEFGTTIKLRDGSGKDLWVSLDDGSDLAVIAAPPPIRSQQPSANPKELAPADRVFEGANIIVLGYPGIVGNEYLVRAISRGGIIAWTDPKDPAGKRFLIDANIYPGNSGGPAISSPNNTTPQGGGLSAVR